MDEQFDKKLTNHIREVFDNYEHPDAGRGWEQLRKKLPAEQKSNKVAWLWWSSAAAVIIVFLGIGLWYTNPAKTTNNLALKPAAKKQQHATTPAQTKDTITTAPVQHLNTQEPVIAQNEAPVYNRPFVLPVVPPGGVPPTQTENVTVGHPQPGFNNTQTNAIAQTNTRVNNAKPLIDSQKVNHTITGQPQMAATQPAVNAEQANTPVTANSMAKKQKTLTDMLAENSLNTTAKKNSTAKQADKKVNFSVYAATYFNYAEGSANQINAGAGFTSDFKLSKRLKLSTGVALAQNSLSYNAGPPQAANSLMAAAPALNRENSFATAAVLPVFKNYNASLVGLDIPINIKYEFNPDKTDAFISAGLSSGTFIDESYTYRYGYGNGATVNDNAVQQQTSHNSFNNFYFGKMLNLSFGLGYPVGGNRLIIEPFVKYPLGGLGAQDIRFGSGGVNLKFSFTGKK
jgi:hypothetical protein